MEANTLVNERDSVVIVTPSGDDTILEGEAVVAGDAVVEGEAIIKDDTVV